MLDPKNNSLNDFNMKDSEGKIMKGPSVPMLIEELHVSVHCGVRESCRQM